MNNDLNNDFKKLSIKLLELNKNNNLLSDLEYNNLLNLRLMIDKSIKLKEAILRDEFEQSINEDDDFKEQWANKNGTYKEKDFQEWLNNNVKEVN
jgi:hypothetical protein